jgi:diketogulonate reductase-like aldo/keto reductase
VSVIKRRFGWTSVEVPVIGQGTWMIEGNGYSELRAIETLRVGLELGMTHIDTAEMYGDGHTEEIVAEVISGQRDNVFLVSKVLPSHASYEGTIRACEQSLRRLKTEWLDLYLLHWPISYPIRGTMRAMKLVTEGLVRFIGVSNFDVEELQAAEETLRDKQIACNWDLASLHYIWLNKGLLSSYCGFRYCI